MEFSWQGCYLEYSRMSKDDTMWLMRVILCITVGIFSKYSNQWNFHILSGFYNSPIYFEFHLKKRYAIWENEEMFSVTRKWTLWEFIICMRRFFKMNFYLFTKLCWHFYLFHYQYFLLIIKKHWKYKHKLKNLWNQVEIFMY